MSEGTGLQLGPHSRTKVPVDTLSSGLSDWMTFIICLFFRLLLLLLLVLLLLSVVIGRAMAVTRGKRGHGKAGSKGNLDRDNMRTQQARREMLEL